MIRENVVIRSTAQHPVDIGNYVLIGPRASLNGCRVEDEVFLATGVTVFMTAEIAEGFSDVRFTTEKVSFITD